MFKAVRESIFEGGICEGSQSSKELMNIGDAESLFDEGSSVKDDIEMGYRLARLNFSSEVTGPPNGIQTHPPSLGDEEILPALLFLVIHNSNIIHGNMLACSNWKIICFDFGTRISETREL